MALVQRVNWARVNVEGAAVGVIGKGLLVFLGVKRGDSEVNARELAAKVRNLRIFADETGKMNRNVVDVAGDLLVVSQFTLYGNTVKGNRPSFSDAAPAEIARPLYEDFVKHCQEGGITVATGVFQAEMEVLLSNEGPVTLLCRSENGSEL